MGWLMFIAAPWLASAFGGSFRQRVGIGTGSRELQCASENHDDRPGPQVRPACSPNRTTAKVMT